MIWKIVLKFAVSKFCSFLLGLIMNGPNADMFR
jgi:hypothetical protein